MPHPIFDRSSYPWDRPEASALRDRLVAAMPDQKEVATVYQQAGGQPGALNTGQAPAGLWNEALNLLAQAGALRKLCQQTLPSVTRLQGNSDLHDAIAAVLGARPAVAATIITGEPVLDRQRLRLMVASLQSGSAARVLVVRGERHSGKSHGRHIFLSAAADCGAEAVYLYEPLVVNVEQAIRRLFRAFGAETRIPPRDTTQAAWYEAVCGALHDVAQGCGRQLWVAVDDLGVADDEGTPLLDPEIASFCNQFVLELGNPSFGRWFRLMLIHYPEPPLPTRWLRDIWLEDRTTADDVQQEHVEEYLRELAAGDGTNLPSTDTMAAELMAAVDAPASAADGPRLQRIYDKLVETREKMEQGRLENGAPRGRP